MSHERSGSEVIISGIYGATAGAGADTSASGHSLDGARAGLTLEDYNPTFVIPRAILTKLLCCDTHTLLAKGARTHAVAQRATSHIT
jgi:hypothetical protein